MYCDLEFINWKGYFLVVTYAVTYVDHHGHFTHINASWLAGVHHSLLPELMEWKKFAPGVLGIQIEGVTISLILTENFAYPLHPWLMIPFTGCPEAAV